jgi:DNA-binding transcriptional ArsR family regulator
VKGVEQLVAVLKALSDEGRLRILGALTRGELCVCQITALIDLAPSTISKHLAILKSAGLVQCRKEGRWIYYCLVGPEEDGAARRAVEWVRESLAAEPRIRNDRDALIEIIKKTPTELCALQD